jgi:proline iminopeptidase
MLNHEVEGWLDVGDGHSIHWLEDGNREGPTVLMVHGGPGGALSRRWGEFFDPTHWRRIHFDQRGCGESRPFGELANNTTGHLVNDMEALRNHLDVDKWFLFGGSWGTTLALAYGLTFPAACAGFLLRGVWLARLEDMEWFLWDVKKIYPEAHERFMRAIETACGKRPQSYQDVLNFTEAPLRSSSEAGKNLAEEWAQYETSMSFLIPLETSVGSLSEQEKRYTVSMSLLERHFIADVLPHSEPILPNLPKIAHLPCHIVHGRMDMVCPVEQAFELAKAWPGSHLQIVEGAGHATFEPGNRDALKRAADALTRTTTVPQF